MGIPDQPKNAYPVCHLLQKGQSPFIHTESAYGRFLDNRDTCDPVFFNMEFDHAENGAGYFAGAWGQNSHPVGLVLGLGTIE